MVCADPPKRETTRPVPRHGGQGLVSFAAVGASSAIGRLRLPGTMAS
jgi:hypothetical protein